MTDLLTILNDDCLNALERLEPGSVRCVVTSPPYWGLRDYGLPPTEWPDIRFKPVSGLDHEIEIPAMSACLGQAADMWAFVGHIVHVFRLVRRAMSDDGTLWVNMGDSYANVGKWGGSSGGKHVDALHGNSGIGRTKKQYGGLKPKDICGLPWRVALALQADGWYLRAENIWHKPNPMPESTKDRTTRAHEQVFMFSKSKRYFYDADAVKQACEQQGRIRDDVIGGKNGHKVRHSEGGRYTKVAGWQNGATGKGHDTLEHNQPRPYRGSKFDQGKSKAAKEQTGAKVGTKPRLNKQDGVGKPQYVGFNARYAENPVETRNLRSVWRIATQPCSEAHYATFPEALAEICIKAGSAPGDLVLDPFAGRGTVGKVAIALGRRAVMIEKSAEYVETIMRPYLSEIQGRLL